MESEWRFNVADWNMTRTPWRLAARMRGVNEGLVIAQYGQPDDPGVLVWFAGPDLIPISFAVFPKLAPHFPFGYEVDPD